MAYTNFNNDAKQKIQHADRCLKKYYRAVELENKAKQVDISGVAFSGMPSNPSPGNYVEDKMADKADDAYKYHKFQLDIEHTLDDVIWVESSLWYNILTKKYLKQQTATKVYMDLHISHTTYQRKKNVALLHFDEASDLDLSIFD